MKPSRQEPEWKLPNQLAKHGFKLDDIEKIIITHLHGDHYGNNPLFPKARFYIHKDEIPLCLAASPWAPFYRPGFKRYLLEVIDQVVLVDGDMQICEGVRVIHVGGHSPGLLSVLVDTEIGRVVIASDIIHSYKNLELNWPIGSYWDLNQVIRGMRRLRRIADFVLPNHDAELWQRFPQGVIG
jgi:glyoxylase-like metal-dependent hydrolase (beta-lactamase superfamily II)